MTDHLTAAREALLDLRGCLPMSDFAYRRLTEAFMYVGLAEAERRKPGLPEGWVEVRVALDPDVQEDLRVTKSTWHGAYSSLLRDALVSQHPEPEPELAPGDIVWWKDHPPDNTHYLMRIEHVAHGQAFVINTDNGGTNLAPTGKLVRLDSIPDSVDTSWHDQHPIDGSQP